ncbi:cytochrome P450 family protein [Kutzneria albida]|uniref:Cytochrome P450 107B1 n=1 Tax=Kutzneria albida DSM 43870 TaxID=1449976 RepID=W5WGM0_9PSEU|nr:cytochrome P450 [Kutzneria albida]AHH97309.1 Cytochrome P450 107B1 [Kutzneria albida DSM 43870]
MPTPSCPAQNPGSTSLVLDPADGVVLLDDSFTADPYPLYELLRTQRPVTRARMPLGPSFWLVTRYEDVRAGLTDPRLVKDAGRLAEVIRRASGIPEDAASADMALHDHMLNSDPPRHTRLRKLVNKAFTGRAIGQLRPRIEVLATELTEAMAARLAAGEQAVDLVEDYAFPLPMTVICEILGVPEGRRREFGSWSHTILSAASPEQHAAASAAMGEYLNQLVADKLANPGADILSAILAPDEDADRLTHVEATAMASLLLVAGHETTVNLIGSGVLALLRNPGQLARLRADPALLPGAVEEFLRLESPVNVATMRFAAEPVTIGGTTIPAGEVVLLGIGSANRDPELFERPGELDLDRARGGSLAFGHGIHHCLGAALARLEGEIAFRVLLERFPTLTLAVDPSELSWHNSILLRGLARLPVRADG